MHLLQYIAMINKLINGFYIILTFIFLVYLSLPSPAFPQQLDNAPQSKEPGDNLDLTTKRAYFVNLNREDITSHYYSVFKIPYANFINSIKLNYPPEEAEWHIYSHTKSSYLEEFVFPFRESIFVNGYQPGPKDDQIAFEGQPYTTKVTIKYKSSNLITRLTFGLLLSMFLYLSLNLFKNLIFRLIKILKL